MHAQNQSQAAEDAATLKRVGFVVVCLVAVMAGLIIAAVIIT